MKELKTNFSLKRNHSNDHSSSNYYNIVAVLVEAVKDLKAEIDQL